MHSQVMVMVMTEVTKILTTMTIIEVMVSNSWTLQKIDF